MCGNMGGGSSTGGGGMNKLLDNIAKNSDSVLNQLSQYSKQMDISKAKFTANGNSVSFQAATIERGNDKIDFVFSTDYDPRQVTKPTKNIRTHITATVWKDGNAQSYNVLSETKTKSLKNAKTQYENMLNDWKKATGQKQIDF